MYSLSADSASLADLIFGFVGIWMAHRLYKSPCKRWQCVLTWAIIYVFLIFFTHPINDLMPDMSYERASMVLGFCGIFAYIYLFPNIPVSQRFFTYFLVDTSQTLTVLFSRVISTLAAQWWGASDDVVFWCVYAPIELAFIFAFHKWLRDYIIASLKAFRTQLKSLALFAAIGYITLILQVPTWEAWLRLDFWTAGGALGMIAFVLTGYVLAFRTLRSLLTQEDAENSARRLASQIAMSERYYKTLLERIESVRIINHDMRHHLNTLSGLCAEGKWDEVSRYVSDMASRIPASVHSSYCGVGALDALLGHYESLCAEKDIPFRCQVRLPELSGIDPLHLCVIFGNGLQNAVEASEKLDASKRGISIRALIADGCVAVSIANSFAGNVQADANGDIATSKPEPGHGLGMASIRETARGYNGWSGFTAKDGIFTLNVMLPIEN